MKLMPQKRCDNGACQVHIWKTATVCWNCGMKQGQVGSDAFDLNRKRN